MNKNVFLILILSLCVNYAWSQRSNSNTATHPSNEVGIIVAPIPDQIYSGTAFTPDPVVKDGNFTLIKNKDYTINYMNNVNVGVAIINIIGKGNYRDSKEIKFNIVAKSINQVMVTPVNDQTFRNTPISPDILIKDGARTLIKDTDYTITVTNNVNVGTASIIITGKGNYKDSKTINFRIIAKSMSSK